MVKTVSISFYLVDGIDTTPLKDPIERSFHYFDILRLTRKLQWDVKTVEVGGYFVEMVTKTRRGVLKSSNCFIRTQLNTQATTVKKITESGNLLFS